MKISSVRLVNFKKFADVEIDISSDLTLFLGPNSSGKSSVIKALLGLKQTILPSNESEGFSTQGDYVDLGTYHDFVYSHNPKNLVSLGVTLQSDVAPVYIYSRVGTMRHLVRGIKYLITFDYNANTEQPRVHSERVTVSVEGIEPDLVINIERKKTRDGFRFRVNKEFCDAIDPYLRPDQRRRSQLWVKGLDLVHAGRLTFKRVPNKGEYVPDIATGNWIPTLQSQLHNALANELYYIGPIRSAPSRNYIRTSHSSAVGPRGEYTASVLANLDKRRRKVTTGTSGIQVQYNFLRSALMALFPGKEFSPQTIHELIRLEFFDSVLDVRGKRRGESIMDVGFGFSQIFPVIVQLAVMPKGSTLIVEQPELHLHPLAQTSLAKVFRLAAVSGKRILAETHSDHLIRGLQLEVSERRRDQNAGLDGSQVKVVYIDGKQQEPTLLEMGDDGEFTSGWPEGFMDLSYQVVRKIVQNRLS